MAQLIDTCLLDDPDQRPTARELVDKLSKAAQEGASGARPRSSKRSSVVGTRSPAARQCSAALRMLRASCRAFIMIKQRD